MMPATAVSHLSGLAKRLLLLLGLPAAILVGGFYAYLIETTNFHAVIAGELYRSSQPTPERIAQLHAQYGIRTIINLRGENIGHGWYDDEVDAARQLDIKHIDFQMSSRHELTQERAAQLIQLMRDAPKPILIHCQAGSDRTGLATALYLKAIAGVTASVAQSQMSIFYGHIPLPITSAYAMDRTFAKL